MNRLVFALAGKSGTGQVMSWKGFATTKIFDDGKIPDQLNLKRWREHTRDLGDLVEPVETLPSGGRET